MYSQIEMYGGFKVPNWLLFIFGSILVIISFIGSIRMTIGAGSVNNYTKYTGLAMMIIPIIIIVSYFVFFDK